MSRDHRSRAYQRYLNKDLKRARTPEGYDNWRATVPHTNAEIIAALCEYAKGFAVGSYEYSNAMLDASHIMRTGKFSAAVLGKALTVLIKQCECCDKKALYRVGNKGRCAEHKLVPEKYTQELRRRREARSNDEQATRNAIDAMSKKCNALKITKQKGHK